MRADTGTGTTACRRPPAGAWVLVALSPCLLVPMSNGQEPGPLKETRVGMTARLEGVVLPGPELEPLPLDDRRRPVVVQSLRAAPHGTAFRYEIEYYGLDPGAFDLRDFLRRKDGGSTADLPPVPVKVVPVRPPGQVEPNPLSIAPGPRIGGYRLLALAAGGAWAVGTLALVASFFLPRRRRAEPAGPRPVSLADRLRPLVEGAVAGKLSQPELAALERGLFALWRRRLGLEAAAPAAAMSTLRAHPDAGPLLAELEAWLHKPGPAATVNVGALLKPYQDLPPDAAELPEAPAR